MSVAGQYFTVISGEVVTHMSHYLPEFMSKVNKG